MKLSKPYFLNAKPHEIVNFICMYLILTAKNTIKQSK